MWTDNFLKGLSSSQFQWVKKFKNIKYLFKKWFIGLICKKKIQDRAEKHNQVFFFQYWLAFFYCIRQVKAQTLES